VDFLRGIDIGTIVIQFVVLLFSLSIHEASHAWMADRLGDYTARYLGRVTLNPLAHIDPIGTLLFPLLQFFTHLPLIGWAKPVPMNPAHLRNPRRDQMWISLAGPGANLLAGTVALVLLVALKVVYPPAGEIIVNLILGMRMPAQQSILTPLVGILFFALIINLALALFNLIPIPPLDGHWLLYGLLTYDAAKVLERVSSYGFLFLYALMFLGIFQYLFIPIGWVLAVLVRV
jgi:Zn-dependent protease